jgi:ubiquinone/menaquinone biosynthesis C-methylase UbiE
MNDRGFLKPPLPSDTQFNPIAEKYRHSPVHRSGPSLAKLVEYCEPRRSDKVLDVATGTGHTALALAPHVDEVIGIDIAERMLELALLLAKEQKINNVRFLSASAEQIPFPDRTFDLITSRLAPHHFGNAREFLAEVRRLLAAGGRFVIADQISRSANIRSWVDQWERRRDPSHRTQRTPDDWRALAEAAGLQWKKDVIVDYSLDFDWWVTQAKCAPSVVEELVKIASDLDAEARQLVRLEYDGNDRVRTYHLPVMIARLEA